MAIELLSLYAAAIFESNYKLLVFELRYQYENIKNSKISKLTNSMAYGTRRFNAAFTRALQ